MPIEFREVRRGEIDDALAFAAAQGADLSAPAIRHQLSLVALSTRKTILGSALHEKTDDGRRLIHIHLKPDVHPGLGRLLIDRALRKIEAADIATTHIAIAQEAAKQTTWQAADWLSRLHPASPPTAKPSPATAPHPSATPAQAAQGPAADAETASADAA